MFDDYVVVNASEAPVDGELTVVEPAAIVQVAGAELIEALAESEARRLMARVSEEGA